MTAEGPRHERDRRPPNAGYLAAAAVLVVSGAFVLGLGVFGGIRNGLTVREVIAGAIGLAVAVIAGLLLRREREKLGRGRQS